MMIDNYIAQDSIPLMQTYYSLVEYFVWGTEESDNTTDIAIRYEEHDRFESKVMARNWVAV